MPSSIILPNGSQPEEISPSAEDNARRQGEVLAARVGLVVRHDAGQSLLVREGGGLPTGQDLGALIALAQREDRRHWRERLGGLADEVIVANATGNESLFLGAVRHLVEAIREFERGEVMAQGEERGERRGA